MKDQHESARTLIFSQRNSSLVKPFRCAHFEFEDVIASIDQVEMLAPRIDSSNQKYLLAKRLAYHTPLKLHPGIEQITLESDYDLFFAILGDPTDMLRVNAIQNWRSRCKKAICLIDEMWVREIPHYRRFVNMLREFDVVCLYYSQSVEPLNKVIGPRSMYVAPAVDAIRFSPFPDQPDRVVDFYSIGRRSAKTHQSLVDWASRDTLYYVYDTTSADRVLDQAQHRELYANTLKRSRYFIVNPALIDRPDVRGSQIEIGYRYFDGIAAGAINVGMRAENDVFAGLFDWQNSILDLPYDSAGFEKVVAELEKDPAAVEQIRRTNVRQALLRHDWVYRWETILESVGLKPLPQIENRKSRLRDLAELTKMKAPLQMPKSREAVMLRSPGAGR